MKRLFMGITTIITLLLLNTFGLALHASAMPMTSHDMSGMKHRSSSEVHCDTLCRAAVLRKEEAFKQSDVEENNEPMAPYYLQLQAYKFSEIDINNKLYAIVVKPPLKVPIYILYGISRN